MADDVDALMAEIGVERADIFGYSMGGATALQLAIRHPDRVDRLVIASAGFRSDSQYPEVLDTIATITPETFAGTPYETEYLRLAPNPDAFATLVEKLVAFDAQPFAWPPDQINAITAPTMILTTHTQVMTRVDWLNSMITEFLDTPSVQTEPPG